MLSLFKKKSSIDYKTLHEDLAKDYAQLENDNMNAGDEHVNLLQRIDKLEVENSRLGNAMFDILKQDTPGGNATVKRVMAIAKNAVFNAE